MKEVKTNKGLLKFGRNLGVLGTTSFVLISIGFAQGFIEIASPAVSYIASGSMLLNAGITGSITYGVHKELKKLK